MSSGRRAVSQLIPLPAPRAKWADRCTDAVKEVRDVQEWN